MDLFKDLTLWLASGTELAAALVISLATIEAVVRAVLLFVDRSARTPNAPDHGGHDAKEEIRLKLGRWLALALEFELAADILRTAVAPTWTEIGQLAAIAVLRTALNYFLQREIDGAEARDAQRRAGTRSEGEPGTSAEIEAVAHAGPGRRA